MRSRLTRLARWDISSALRQSGTLFGVLQLERYADLISRTIQIAALDPSHPRSRPRSTTGLAARSLHVEVAAGRRGGASHEIVYAVVPNVAGEDELVVLRVLHEAMSTDRRIAAAVREELTPPSRPRRPRSPGR